MFGKARGTRYFEEPEEELEEDVSGYVRPNEPEAPAPASTRPEPKSQVQKLRERYFGPEGLRDAQRDDNIANAASRVRDGAFFAITGKQRQSPKADGAADYMQQAAMSEANDKKRAAEADKDPASPKSRFGQSFIRKYNPELAAEMGTTLDRMSLGDILQMNPLLKEVLDKTYAREAAAAKAQEEETKRLRTREEKLGDTANQREYDAEKTAEQRTWQAEQNRLTRATRANNDPLDAELKRARIEALKRGPRGSDPVSQRKRDLEIQKLEKELGLGDEPAKSSPDDIYKWNSRVSGKGIRKGLQSLASIDRITVKYGGVDKVPGVGYVEGETPTEALPPDAQQFRQEASSLISEYRNKLFGASLSDNERADFKKIADLGGRATASQVSSALAILRRGLIADAQEALAGAPDDVKEPIFGDLGVPYERKAPAKAKPKGETGSFDVGGPTPTGRMKTDANGVVWERMSDGSARKRGG